MKKSIISFAIFIFFILIISLTSCAMFDDYEKLCNEKIEIIISAATDNEPESIKSLFSKNTIDSDEKFDEKVSEFIDFFEGTYQSYDSDGLYTSEDIDSNKVIKFHRISYDVFTTKYVYRIAFKWYSKYDYDNNNLGISSLYVTRLELNSNLDEAYWGDVSNSIGLFIEK